VSLGKGGYIVLGFEFPIIDGPGVDFTVFENAFLFPGGIFDEWMTVSVSPDGESWLVFPYDTITGEGMAGRTPAAGGVDHADPAVSGGDSFDLADLGLDTVRYVRVDDATQYQGPDRLSAELDAVIAVHTIPVGLTGLLPAHLQLQRSGGQWDIRALQETEVRLMTIHGQEVYRAVLAPQQPMIFSPSGLSAGVYIWAFFDRKGVYFQKWIH
jgi:hypothetical protein